MKVKYLYSVESVGSRQHSTQMGGEAWLTSPGPAFLREGSLCSGDRSWVRSPSQWQLMTSAAGLCPNADLRASVLGGQEAAERLSFRFITSALWVPTVTGSKLSKSCSSVAGSLRSFFCPNSASLCKLDKCPLLGPGLPFFCSLLGSVTHGSGCSIGNTTCVWGRTLPIRF